MPTLRIIWDVLFRGEFVTQKGTDVEVAKSMDTQCSDYKIEAVLRWNTVLAGQKVARAGFTSGLRYLIPVDHISNSEIKTLLDSLQNKTDQLNLNPYTKKKEGQYASVLNSVPYH